MRRTPSASNEFFWPWTNYLRGLGAFILVGLLTAFSLGLAYHAFTNPSLGVRLFCGVMAIPPWLAIYPIVASPLNRTRVTLNGTQLSFRHEPFPWFPIPSVELAEVTAVVIRQEHYSQTRRRRQVINRSQYAVIAQYAQGSPRTVARCRDRKHAERIRDLILQCRHIQAAQDQIDPKAISPGAAKLELDNLPDDGVPFKASRSQQVGEWLVSRDGAEWTATWDWYAPKTGIVTVAFCLIVLIGVPYLTFFGPNAKPIELPLLIALIVGLSVFVLGIYGGLALLLNRSEVRWGDGILHQRHFPIPWPSAAPIATDDIVDIKVERVIRSRDRRRGGKWTYLYDYQITVHLRDGQKVRFEKSHIVDRIQSLHKILRGIHRASNGAARRR